MYFCIHITQTPGICNHAYGIPEQSKATLHVLHAPSTPWSRFPRFPSQNVLFTSPHHYACNIPRPSDPLDMLIGITHVKSTKHVALCNVTSCTLHSPFPSYVQYLLFTLLPNTPNLHFSINPLTPNDV
jgi:hypothetical protein